MTGVYNWSKLSFTPKSAMQTEFKGNDKQKQGVVNHAEQTALKMGLDPENDRVKKNLTKYINESIKEVGVGRRLSGSELRRIKLHITNKLKNFIFDVMDTAFAQWGVAENREVDKTNFMKGMENVYEQEGWIEISRMTIENDLKTLGNMREELNKKRGGLPIQIKDRSHPPKLTKEQEQSLRNSYERLYSIWIEISLLVEGRNYLRQPKNH